MSTKYHISEKTGPGVCKAQSPDTCPLRTDEGDKSPHFETEAEAQKFFEKSNEEKYGSVPEKVSKSVDFRETDRRNVKSDSVSKKESSESSSRNLKKVSSKNSRNNSGMKSTKFDYKMPLGRKLEDASIMEIKNRVLVSSFPLSKEESTNPDPNIRQSAIFERNAYSDNACLGVIEYDSSKNDEDIYIRISEDSERRGPYYYGQALNKLNEWYREVNPKKVQKRGIVALPSQNGLSYLTLNNTKENVVTDDEIEYDIEGQDFFNRSKSYGTLIDRNGEYETIDARTKESKKFSNRDDALRELDRSGRRRNTWEVTRDSFRFIFSSKARSERRNHPDKRNAGSTF